jgi:hypothetical protein
MNGKPVVSDVVEVKLDDHGCAMDLTAKDLIRK